MPEAWPFHTNSLPDHRSPGDEQGPSRDRSLQEPCSPKMRTAMQQSRNAPSIIENCSMPRIFHPVVLQEPWA